MQNKPLHPYADFIVHVTAFMALYTLVMALFGCFVVSYPHQADAFAQALVYIHTLIWGA